MRSDMSELLGDLLKRIQQVEGVRKTRMEGMCENCGCELKKNESRKASNGKMLCEMLCEKCCEERMAQKVETARRDVPQDDMRRLLARMAEVGSFAEAKPKSKEEPELGGERYAKLVKSLEKGGAEDPKALAAWIGRKKLGKEEFQKRAAAGKAAAQEAKALTKGYALKAGGRA